MGEAVPLREEACMMKRRLAMLCAALVLGLLAACGGGDPSPDSYTGDFLAWTGSSDALHYFTLVRVNGQDGSVTNIGGSDFFTALVYAPDGTLYGVSDELHSIDPSDGTTVLIGAFRHEGSLPILMRGAAFSPAGKLYVAENGGSRVFTVDLNTAALAYVGTPAVLIWGMEFSSTGKLYAAFADLFTLFPSDMSTASTVGSTGIYAGPLTFGQDRTLFTMDIYPSTRIYSLSLTSGLADPVVTAGSSALRSLVAERKPSATAAVVHAKARGLRGPAPARPRAELQDLEARVRRTWVRAEGGR